MLLKCLILLARKLRFIFVSRHRSVAIGGRTAAGARQSDALHDAWRRGGACSTTRGVTNEAAPGTCAATPGKYLYKYLYSSLQYSSAI